MGRTVKTATQVLNEQVEWWGKYRRALRARDRKVLDKLLGYSKKHFAGLGYSSCIDSVDVMLVSMLLEMQKEIEELRDEGFAGRLLSRTRSDYSLVQDVRGDVPGV
ncbi:MAG: hypothetical protein ABH851_09340, partial [Methanobacteriota archaeon]